NCETDATPNLPVQQHFLIKNRWEHEVMLTHRLSGVETASTPARRSRYTSRIAAPTSDCSFPRTTRLPRVTNGHGRFIGSTVPGRRSPAESLRGETCRRQSGPDGHCLHRGVAETHLCCIMVL